MGIPLAVLIVEDTESDAQLIVRLLKKASYEINFEQVETAAQMRAMLEKQVWDVVISDYSLPQFNGHAALRLLQEMGLDIPFIVVSGTIGEEIAVDMMKVGAHDYLMKGNLARLVPAVERELAQSEVRRKRKQAEEAIKLSHKRFQSLIENSADAITLLDANGIAIYDSPASPGMLGYDPDELIGQNVFTLMHADDLPKIQDLFQNLLKTPGARANSTFRLRHKNGTWLWIEAVATNLLAEPSVKAIVTNYRDISERKQAEEALRESEERYRTLIEQASDGIFLADNEGRYIEVNSAGCRLLGYTREEILQKTIRDLTMVAPAQPLRLDEIRQGKTILSEREMIRKDGTLVPVEISAKQLPDGRLQGIARDITERKLAEDVLRDSEAELRALFSAMHDVVIVYDRQGRYLSIAPTDVSLLYKPPTDMIGKTLHEVLPASQADLIVEHIHRALDTKQTVMLDYSLTIDGREIWFAATISSSINDTAILVAHDITERKRAESKFSGLLESAPDAMVVVDQQGKIAMINKQTEALFGYTRQELVGQLVEVIIPERFRNAHPARRTGYTKAPSIRPMGDGVELSARRKDGSEFPVEISLSPLETAEGLLITAAIRDITERKRAEELIKTQLQRLAALRAIDTAISGSTDLQFTLKTALDQVITELGVDAASVLLLYPSTLTLKYTAGRGFRSNAYSRTQVRLGEGQAGKAALERQIVAHPDFTLNKPFFAMPELMAGENFAAYYAVPLIAKGFVKGVLEIFHRAPLHPDNEWLNFLETLGGQIAIAIDNATMFNDLHRSNFDLMNAYNATIEGWSRALDLRDKETEGHTQRVTEMTMRLARAMGLTDDALMQIQRGALLHDMGKLGVPDAILLKTDKLTEEEWIRMKQHPQFAYDMLAPIPFLKKALDIPYCHHEKWDGTGYPRGLKGEQIPLAARIFAIVDVWDALRSDRPYRQGWSEEKVREHIRANSGTHFDPQVVEAFMRMLEEK